MQKCGENFQKSESTLVDVTGVVLTPGNFGRECSGNGFHKNEYGETIECCCDECDYLLCCTSVATDCETCKDLLYPRIKR